MLFNSFMIYNIKLIEIHRRNKEWVMIGQLCGKILLVKPPQLLLDVAGVGYELDLPIPDCASLAQNKDAVVIYTHLVIREDAHSLFGFTTLVSRDCFRTLLKVSGIGPRIALALLSTLSPQQLQCAVEQADIVTLSRTPGVGKKMAERMVLELKGKLRVEAGNELAVGDTGSGSDDLLNQNRIKSINVRSDIVDALSSLGYNDKETAKIMQQLPLDITDISFGIKEALRILNR
ncbi:MAG: holliday junction helicase RuvA [Pseudomonadota bacterium]|nr:holliday junction helicase RuvA [Pseudomonadota bacterium]